MAENILDATITDEQYFADEAIDQSLLKEWLKGPASLGLYLRDQENNVETPSMRMGTAMHTLTLGAGLPVKEKPARAKTDDEHTWLTSADFVKATTMEQLGGAKQYFESLEGTPEVTMMCDHPATGLRLKAKADWLPANVDEDGVYRIRDYKTTIKPLDSADAAARVIYGDMRYDIQAAFYMMVYRLTTGWDGPLGFEFVIQSKGEPFNTVRARIEEQSDANQATLARIQDGLISLKEAWGDKTREEFKETLLQPQPVVDCGVVEPPAWWQA